MARQPRATRTNTPRAQRLAQPAPAGAPAARNAAGLPNVAYIRPELYRMLPIYEKIIDCLDGSHAVKAKGEKYLPKPNAADLSAENTERYKAYVTRAVFYNVTFRTAHALVGQIFLRDPQIDVPTSLEPVTLDANGEGVTINQTAKLASLHTLTLGRCGLHVDFSSTPGGITAASAATGDYRPVVYEYAGHEIRNWRKAKRGSRMVYTLIVVEEEYNIEDDGFEVKTDMQLKVMRLVSPAAAQADLLTRDPERYGDLWDNAITEAQSAATDIYMLEVWRAPLGGELVGSERAYTIAERYYPKQHNGKFLNEIPFKFIGSEQNDDTIDAPPFAAISEINLGHYRNSADYEESVFLVGQPTPVVSGVTQEWNENVFKGQMALGSRAVIPLPAGGNAQLLQAAANGMAKEALDQKERQMVALGAKLVEQRAVQRTATEAEMESTADTSILADIADNVSAGMQWALQTCCLFTGDNSTNVSYILNKEFDLTKMPADARQQLLLEYEADMITFEEMRANLRRGGIATLDDKTAKKELDAQKKEKADAAVLQANAAAKLNVKPVDPNATPPGNSPGNTPT